MAEQEFKGFDWDTGNDTKNLTKHSIVREVIEALFHTSPPVTEDKRHSEKEQRFVTAGLTKGGRWILVVFTIREKAGQKFVRPISARYMHDKEVKRYEKADKNQN